jgi:hypothetical protein
MPLLWGQPPSGGNLIHFSAEILCMYLTTLAVAEGFGLARDDVVRLFNRGVIERPS